LSTKNEASLKNAKQLEEKYPEAVESCADWLHQTLDQMRENGPMEAMLLLAEDVSGDPHALLIAADDRSVRGFPPMLLGKCSPQTQIWLGYSQGNESGTVHERSVIPMPCWGAIDPEIAETMKSAKLW
jgi:hypothetical protein